MVLKQRIRIAVTTAIGLIAVLASPHRACAQHENELRAAPGTSLRPLTPSGSTVIRDQHFTPASHVEAEQGRAFNPDQAPPRQQFMRIPQQYTQPRSSNPVDDSPALISPEADLAHRRTDTELKVRSRSLTAPDDMENQPFDYDPAGPKGLEPGQNVLDLGGTMQKIAMSTFGVLTACVVVLLLYRKLGFKGPLARTNSQSGMQTIDSFTIAPKCVLHLVNINGMKVVVAMDAQGIKSMVPFASFREELAASRLDDEHSAEERNAMRFTESRRR